ncbi:MAG: hypothetical protein CAPSK01_003050 [Candidatus Accumulibacter vicinus]|uniref:Uncharacterized protein n=1 Tax=Candidatus Accumulibacter vicinus TaxID=2954382 RepID=A0A084XYR3_9PROT|nr:MAG: hypothetical protein CAPSK01_003050 [Candidatus Accumulibacter vicinus]
MTQRVAIHRGIVVCRHIGRCNHVAGQNASQRAAQRQPFLRLQRCQLAANEGSCLLDRQCIGIVIVETTEAVSEMHGRFRRMGGGLSVRHAGRARPPRPGTAGDQPPVIDMKRTTCGASIW